MVTLAGTGGTITGDVDCRGLDVDCGTNGQTNGFLRSPGTVTAGGGRNALELNANGSVRVSGAIGLNGKTPPTAPNFTITNPTADRLTLDQTSATAAEVREVLGTVVAKLIDLGAFS